MAIYFNPEAVSLAVYEYSSEKHLNKYDAMRAALDAAVEAQRISFAQSLGMACIALHERQTEMTMREKIARALHAKRFSADARDEWTRVGAETKDYLLMSDAVLEAMREPTPEMIAAGEYAWMHRTLQKDSEPLLDCWLAMIDAAKEKTE